MDIALIAPPWSLFNRPSIQLGALKAYLSHNLPGDFRVRNLHPYLDVAAAVGFGDYHVISQSGWASEAVFANLLLPGRNGPEQLFYQALKDRGLRKISLDFVRVCEKARQGVDSCIERFDFSATRLVGISVCLNQLTAGLFIAGLLKRRYPEIKVVMGGASVSGGIGQGILRAFPNLDFVIDGEGERPLLNLCRYLLGMTDGIESRAVVTGEESGKAGGKDQVADLDKLPFVDYDDFFKDLSRLEGASGVNVVLPVEASRGCWWGQCTFCNLNLQWKGYRSRAPERIAAELDSLSRRYSSIDFAFMDNCLPRGTAASIFQKLAAHARDYSIFAEIRAVHSRQELMRMKRGGLDSVQIGIEALSSKVLRKLKKGVSVIQNLAGMKNCAELGIDLQANLITCFPSTTKEDAMETLENVEFAWPYGSLKPVRFWLGVESLVFRHYGVFGIRCVRPDRKYFMLFPRDVMELLSPLILEYVGDRKRQERQWRPVEKRLFSFMDSRKALGIRGPALTYRDGGHFLLIRQLLPDGRVLLHRLSGASRKIYLLAAQPVDKEEIFSLLPGIPREKIERFIVQMVAKKLIFSENGQVLSLACSTSFRARG